MSSARNLVPLLLSFLSSTPSRIIAIGLLSAMLAGCRSPVDWGSKAGNPMFDIGSVELLPIATDDRVPVESNSDRNPTADPYPNRTTSYEESTTRSTAADGSIFVLDSEPSDRGSGLEIQSLSLAEALELATQNSEFFVDNGSFLSAANPLLNNPQFAASKFDRELQQSGSESVEAALADFSTKFTSGFQWGRNSFIQSNNNPLASQIFVSDNGTFYGRLDKPITSGGNLSVIHNLNYASSAQSIYVTDPRYAGYVRGEFRQPLLAGRGRTFTDIAGPQSYRSRQQNSGIAMAEIAGQTANLELQLGIQRVRRQAEELYWDCWLARQIFDNQKIALRNAEGIWRRIQNRAETGLTGGGVADEAQAEENFHRRKSLADNASIELEQATERLKHGLGLPDVCGPLLVTTDNPSIAPIVFDLESSVGNALSKRKELMKQDLQIQAIEYQLFAANQLKRPQLDLVSGVQLNGLGDNLFGNNTGALPDLVNTDDVGWNVGFEFSMPLGFQREKLNVRYLQMLLMKARTARRLQEKEIRHEIVYTAKSVERWEQSRDSAQQRLAAAERRLAAVEADYRAGRAALDLFLRAQDSLAEAQVEVARSQAESAKAQLDFLVRQGMTVSSL